MCTCVCSVASSDTWSIVCHAQLYAVLFNCACLWPWLTSNLLYLAKVTFEKMTNRDFPGSTYYTIRNVSLYECLGWCRDEVDCTAASFSFVVNPLAPLQETTCRLQNETKSTIGGSTIASSPSPTSSLLSPTVTSSSLASGPSVNPQKAVNLYYFSKTHLRSGKLLLHYFPPVSDASALAFVSSVDSFDLLPFENDTSLKLPAEWIIHSAVKCQMNHPLECITGCISSHQLTLDDTKASLHLYLCVLSVIPGNIHTSLLLTKWVSGSVILHLHLATRTTRGSGVNRARDETTRNRQHQFTLFLAIGTSE